MKKESNLPVIVPQPVRRPRYWQVYETIPFSRAEYEANPSYRHQATMELLLGQLRPQTIYQYARPRTGIETITPWRYSYDGRSINYHFFYPIPSGYYNY